MPAQKSQTSQSAKKKTSPAAKAKAPVKRPARQSVAPKKVAAKQPTISELSSATNAVKNTLTSRAVMLLLGLGCIILIALTLFSITRKGNEFTNTKPYETAEFSLQYPAVWRTESKGGEFNFFNGQSPETSESGLALVSMGKIPNYTKMTADQKNELIEINKKKIKEGNQGLDADFKKIDSVEVFDLKHVSAEKALRFSFAGELKDGSSAKRVGYMLISSEGESYVLVAGSSASIFEQNANNLEELLKSFRIK